MRIVDTSVPVVVLKAEHYASLGIIRSLGKEGVPVYGIDRSGSLPSFVSRYCADKFIWNIDEEPEEKTVQFLLNVGWKVGKKSILIPTSDEMTLLAAAHADVLEKWFILPALSSENATLLTSKQSTYELAVMNGIPVPRAVFPHRKEDASEFAKTAVYPIIVKGIHGGRLEQRKGRKSIIVNNQNELLRAYNTLEDPSQPNLMLQEYIPGPEENTWMFNGYFNRSSECLVAFTGKKIRQNPVYAGMTSLGVSLWSERLSKKSEEFLKRLGYRGIVDVDYRYDERDHRFKLLDVNPRTGASFRLFVARNGMDVVRAMYLDLTGQRVVRVIQRDGRKWFVEDKDILSSYKYILDGKLKLTDWISSLRGISEAGYFSWSDPLPFFMVWVNHVRRRVSRWFGKKEITKSYLVVGPLKSQKKKEFARPGSASMKSTSDAR